MLNRNSLQRRFLGYRKEGRTREFCEDFSEALRTKQIRPSEVSIRDLAFATATDHDGNPMGREFIECANPDPAGRYEENLLEAVDSAAFKTISGQLIYTAMMEEYELYMAPIEGLYTNTPTKFNGERIPGVTGIGDQAEEIREGDEYPSVQVGEDWVDTPETVKRGLKVLVTKEALFFDRTNLILDRCSKVGQWLGLNKAKRIIDLALGVTNTYKWKDTAYDTYQTTTPWVNINTSNGLSDWSDIDDALQMFWAITDPSTGEPITINPTQIIVNTSKRATANYILNATHVKIGADTASNQMQVENAHMVPGQYEVISSPIIDARYTAGSVTATTWHFGDFRKAFSYMENWPVAVEQMPSNSYEEWNRDIMAGYKAGERGVAAVKDPRYAQRNTA